MRFLSIKPALAKKQGGNKRAKAKSKEKQIIVYILAKKQAGNKRATSGFKEKQINDYNLSVFENSEASNGLVRKHLETLQQLEQSQNFHMNKYRKKTNHSSVLH